MHNSLPSSFFLSLFCLLSNLLVVHATLYVTEPHRNGTYSGGTNLTVNWLDDGSQPLLTAIGPCHVGLYNGRGVLIQQIESVDVSVVHSLDFIPDPKAGPDSSTYYINFTSVSPIGNASYTQFSPFFALDSMSGSFSSPVASDTSALSVPSSVQSAPPNTIASTSIIGTPFSTSVAPPSSSDSASGSASSMTTQRVGSSSSSTSTSSSASASITPPNPDTASSGTTASNTACARFAQLPSTAMLALGFGLASLFFVSAPL